MTDLEQQIREISSLDDIIRIFEESPKFKAAKKAKEEAKAKASEELATKNLNGPAMQRRIANLNNLAGCEVSARPGRQIQDVADIAFGGLECVLSNWHDGQPVINPSDFDPGDFNGVNIVIKVGKNRQGNVSIGMTASAPAKQRALKILFDIYCSDYFAENAGTLNLSSGGISNGSV